MMTARVYRALNSEEAKKVSEGLAQFTRDHKLMEEKWDEMLKSHAYQWVGVYKGEFFFGSTDKEVTAHFDAVHHNIAIKFLHPNPPKLVLGTQAPLQPRR